MSEGLHAPAAPARYLTVGHVTADVLPGGERRPGGTALYSALQAARLGLRATILTRGEPGEIAALLEPFAAELEVIVQPAPATTTLATEGSGAGRRQRLLAWAGPIAIEELPAAEILHLAPVAAELEGPPAGDWPFVGLTPQGLARGWQSSGGDVLAVDPGPSRVAIAAICSAIVLSELERPSCEALVEAGLRAGATVAVTAGAACTSILREGAVTLELDVDQIAEPADDLGAGDVYAAVFFVALAAGITPAEAARRASTGAALRMLGVGPAAIATAEAIDARAASRTD